MRTAYKKGKENEKEKHGIPYTMLEQTATQLKYSILKILSHLHQHLDHVDHDRDSL
jgi:hypothetical protein